MKISPESVPPRLSFPSPPQGLKAIPWRLPIWLYRLGLGRLLGGKFLLLTHRGRKTGQLRQAVLEIILAEPEKNRFLVVSGFGTGSQWYKNIQIEPKVAIQVGAKKISAIAEQLGKEQAGLAIVDYAERFPGNLKTLARILGYEIEHTPAGYRNFGEKIPVIEFTPDTNL